MDDKTVDRLFHMLLLDPLPKYTKKELGRLIGPNNLHKYDPVRVQLTAHLIKTHSDNQKERALTKPVMVQEGRLILNDCSVHGFSYDDAKLEAKGEMDWNQHDQWACAFGQLSDRFEALRDGMAALEGEIEDWQHGEECDAANCYNYDSDSISCDCPFKPELLVDGEIPDDHDYSKEDKIHTECTCGLRKLQKGIEGLLQNAGFVR